MLELGTIVWRHFHHYARLIDPRLLVTAQRRGSPATGAFHQLCGKLLVESDADVEIDIVDVAKLAVGAFARSTFLRIVQVAVDAEHASLAKFRKSLFMIGMVAA